MTTPVETGHRAEQAATEGHDAWRGVWMTPFATRGRRSLPKSAANTAWKGFCNSRWKTSTGSSSA